MVKEDVWIKTTCGICFSNCAIRVHRVDGVVIKIEGNPDCPTSRGGLCARGSSGIMLLYDPNRVNVPLRRTNPNKGIGVDPQWVEISWEEALGEITDRLKKIRAEDPRKLMAITSVTLPDAGRMNTIFTAAFGSPNRMSSGSGVHCGNGSHIFSGLSHAAWTRMPDLNYIKYYLNFGCPSGFGAYYAVTGMAQRMADARKRGMRHVVIDPWMGMAGLKADEWVPIRPGTDAALALAMVNLLLNSYGLYDAESIKRYTNGPYLVGADGHYVRDERSGKPLLWDLSDGTAKTYDDPGVREPAIEGSYLANGTLASPAFSLIKEHVKEYTPEKASEITSVPAATIRRLAREFGEAANIGGTINIDGKELPYRPVAVGYFRGAHAHRHSALNGMSFQLLQEIVGANNVPGGCLGMNSRSFGYPETGRSAYSPSAGPDGMLKAGSWPTPPPPWPVGESRTPETVGIQDLIPTAGSSPLFPDVMTDPDRYGIPYKLGFILQTGGNYLRAIGNPSALEKVLAHDVFCVSFSLLLDESTEFADIVLPDACYLERFDLHVDWMSSISPVDEWAWHIRQPVVEPIFKQRPAQEVMLELADRLGMLSDVYRRMNVSHGIQGPYALDPAKHYTWPDIVDRKLKSQFGDGHGLDWFKENGLIKWPKKTEEVYWRPFVPARVPIYYEHFKTVGEQVDEARKSLGMPDFDTSDFQAMPDWKPCHVDDDDHSGYDLFGIYYRVPIHTFTSTYNNPWLDELSETDQFIYRVAINPQTAKRKGIRDGDWMTIESAGTGHKLEARAALTEAIHPEVIAYASGGGHWARHLPIASQRGKGIAPEWLLPLGWGHMDTVTFSLDLCVKVRVAKKIEGAGQ